MIRNNLDLAHKRLINALGISACTLISACTTSVPDITHDSTHLTPPAQTVSADSGEGIPEIVRPLPMVSEPQAQASPELYSIVALDVPVRELLFAMARDASINIDVHPDITGQVSLNVIDQSLPQLLERISNQVDLRWKFDPSGNLLVEPDLPYWHVYQVDYVNVERTSSTTVNVSNTIVSVGDNDSGIDGNDSSAIISQTSTNSFWATLTSNLNLLLGADDQGDNIVANPESGLININANSKQHKEMDHFLNLVHSRSLQEVIIEATIVEVSLSDNYQSGVDWSAMGGDFSFSQELLGASLENPPTNILSIDGSDITGTVKLLSQFGDLRVLSSPKIMALNNQAAMLRVVDNTVYFSIDVEPAIISNGTTTNPTYTSNIHTVPVGFVMTVTPQIGENEQITLNVRPTISRIVRFVSDPNPILADGGVENLVPEIQVREIESILKVYSGQIAVLGGLMQDSLEQNSAGIPVISKIPGIRNLFSSRDDTTKKTELIIFIRPVIVGQPSLSGDLEEYLDYLPTDTDAFFNDNSFVQPLN